MCFRHNSSSLMECPYCTTGKRYKALEGHIKYKHKGMEVPERARQQRRDTYDSPRGSEVLHVSDSDASAPVEPVTPRSDVPSGYPHLGVARKAHLRHADEQRFHKPHQPSDYRENAIDPHADRDGHYPTNATPSTEFTPTPLYSRHDPSAMARSSHELLTPLFSNANDFLPPSLSLEQKINQINERRMYHAAHLLFYDQIRKFIT